MSFRTNYKDCECNIFSVLSSGICFGPHKKLGDFHQNRTLCRRSIKWVIFVFPHMWGNPSCFRTRPERCLRFDCSIWFFDKGVRTLIFRLAREKMGIFFFRGGSWNFFRVTLKAFIPIQMTVWTIQNDYLDHVRHAWDIFGTIRPLKIIFSD